MISRKKSRITKPFNHNPHIVVAYEYSANGEVVSPGDRIKFTGVRGTFKFIKHVQNLERNVEWLDAMSKDGGFHSFYVSRLKLKVKPKRQRRKAYQIEQAAATGNSTGHCSKCRCELNDSTAAPSVVRRGSGYCRPCMAAYVESRKK